MIDGLRKVGLVYRYVKSQDKLVLCKLSKTVYGYEVTQSKEGLRFVHRMLWETFKGEIPTGYEIDHINTVRDDNRLENLRCVTPAENRNNELTLKHISEAQKGRKHTEESKRKISEAALNKSKSEFGRKYYEHFGCAKYENPKQYAREQVWFKRHGKCRWE